MCNRLLDLLADRKDKTGKSGKVLINGQKRQANYKTMVAYVVQVNTLFSHLVLNYTKVNTLFPPSLFHCSTLMSFSWDVFVSL